MYNQVARTICADPHNLPIWRLRPPILTRIGHDKRDLVYPRPMRPHILPLFLVRRCAEPEHRIRGRLYHGRRLQVEVPSNLFCSRGKRGDSKDGGKFFRHRREVFWRDEEFDVRDAPRSVVMAGVGPRLERHLQMRDPSARGRVQKIDGYDREPWQTYPPVPRSQVPAEERQRSPSSLRRRAD